MSSISFRERVGRSSCLFVVEDGVDAGEGDAVVAGARLQLVLLDETVRPRQRLVVRVQRRVHGGRARVETLLDAGHRRHVDVDVLDLGLLLLLLLLFLLLRRIVLLRRRQAVGGRGRVGARHLNANKKERKTR